MASRQRRRHFGSIREVKKGKVYYLRWTENTPHGRDKPHETVYGTYSDACARMSEIEVVVRRGRRDRVVPSFRQAYEMWYLPSKSQAVGSGKLKQRTLDQYRNIYRYFVAERWDGVPVSEVKTADIESWLSGITKSNGELCKTVIKGVLDECVKRDVIASNPARVKMNDSALGSKRDKGIWSIEQLDEMAWKSIGRPYFYSVILIAFGSCRPGESLGPKLSEIHRKECDGMTFAEVGIVRQVTPQGKLTGDEDLKNDFSPRKVYIPEPWCYPLFHASESPEEGQVLLTDMGYGLHRSQKNIYESFRDAFRRGLMGELEYHPWKNLRPSWETWMNWRNHVQRERIEKIMGHVGSGITAVYYDRPLDVQLMEEIAESFKKYPYKSPYPWKERFT